MRGASVSIEKRLWAYSEDVARASRSVAEVLEALHPGVMTMRMSASWPGAAAKACLAGPG